MANLITKLLSLLMALALAACAGAPRSGDALFQQLGGRSGVDAIAAELIARAADDPAIGFHFIDSDLDETARLLGEQFCELTGGPCRYSGRTMEDSHRGFEIRDGEFDRLVELLLDVMDERRIATPAQNGLVALLATMHSEVVGQ